MVPQTLSMLISAYHKKLNALLPSPETSTFNNTPLTIAAIAHLLTQKQHEIAISGVL